MRGQGMVSPAAQEEERQFEAALRPTRLDDFEGQPHVSEQLSIAIEAAKQARRSHGSRSALRPAGLGQNHARRASLRTNYPFPWTRQPVRFCRKNWILPGILSNVRGQAGFLHRRDSSA